MHKGVRAILLGQFQRGFPSWKSQISHHIESMIFALQRSLSIKEHAIHQFYPDLSLHLYTLGRIENSVNSYVALTHVPTNRLISETLLLCLGETCNSVPDRKTKVDNGRLGHVLSELRHL